MACSPHLSLDLLQEAFYKGLHETFETSNEEREQLQQAQVGVHTFDRIEQASAASSIFSPNSSPNNPMCKQQ
jgi:hypothetical protein